jgi:hypothetical protein
MKIMKVVIMAMAIINGNNKVVMKSNNNEKY